MFKPPLYQFPYKKQRELFHKAEHKVSIDNRQYPFYILDKSFSITSIISFGTVFRLFIGSYVYENVISIPLKDNPSTITTNNKNEDVEIETYVMMVMIITLIHIGQNRYDRYDGTEVEGYCRGGEEGYERRDPGGDPSNNLDNVIAQ